MKKIILALSMMIGSIFTTDAHYYLNGSANLVWINSNTEILTCPGEGTCAKIDCMSNKIWIYCGSDVITGTIQYCPSVSEPNGNGNCELLEPVEVSVTESED